jgi:hypothetical protein
MSDFSEHIVNQRFKRVFEALEAQARIRGKSDLAEQLGTYNHVVNSILKGKRNITIDQLAKLFEHHGVNANYLFGLSEQMFRGQSSDIPVRRLDELQLRGRQNITLVPHRALAGYALDYHDGAYLEGMQRFSIPGQEGQLIAFEISGDSMMPTVTNGDIVVCEPLERGELLRDNQVYVIVTDVVVAKRVQQIKEGSRVSQLRLISDNDHVYKPYEVGLEDIRQILKVKCRLTNYGIH